MAVLAASGLSTGASARAAIDVSGDVSGAEGLSGAPDEQAAPGRLECVPYARRLSGIQIYGNAHTWWDQARGRYATGHRPQVGAVMAMPSYAGSRLGHVATVSRIVDARTILISHANWSPVDGQRGQIEENVTALDVSPENDWSEVRIWYAPIHNLGATHWPVEGFIYNSKPGAMATDATAGRRDEPAGNELAGNEMAARESSGRSTKKGRHSDPIGAIIAGNY